MKVDFLSTPDAAEFLGISSMVFRYWANKLGIQDVHVQRHRPQGKAPLMWRVSDVEWIGEAINKKVKE